MWRLRLFFGLSFVYLLAVYIYSVFASYFTLNGWKKSTVFNVSVRLNVAFCMFGSRLLQFTHPRATSGFV